MNDFLDIAFSNSIYPSYRNDLDVTVTRILLTLGVPAHVKGYQFLREAVIMAIKDRNTVDLITKFIYPDIARIYGTTPSRVERAIRHAVELAWERGDSKILSDCFNISSVLRRRPSNSEFIATLADWVNMNGGYITA
jgi:two-component system response regulator (stage 0 sporulation protein A)